MLLDFDSVPSFSSGGVLSRGARVQSQVERSEPKGNLDGFLVRLHRSQRNEGRLGGVPLRVPISRDFDAVVQPDEPESSISCRC